MKKILLSLLSLILIHISFGQDYTIKNDGADGICSSAWPPEILGNYTENGTFNSRPAYEGPNGYWLYNTDH